MADHTSQLSSQSDEALESQIISARAALRHDVMLLEEKLSPSAIVDRRKRRMSRQWGTWKRRAQEQAREVRQTSRSIKDDVEESMEQAMSETRSSFSTTRERAMQGAKQFPSRAAHSLREGTYSRPLVFAGLAFAAGWGISRMMPVTRPEQELAQKVVPVVEEKAAPLVEEAKSAVSESAREAITYRDM